LLGASNAASIAADDGDGAAGGGKRGDSSLSVLTTRFLELLKNAPGQVRQKTKMRVFSFFYFLFIYFFCFQRCWI
jgi:hypothetical protein